MNRIIIVGNGFDLAHGLKTKYEDFINWYWDKWGQRLRSCSDKQISDGLCSFILKDEVGLAGWYLVWSYHYSISPFKEYTNRQLVETAISDSTVCDYKMHSAFQQGVTSVSADLYTQRGNGSINFINSFFNLKGDEKVDDVSWLSIASGRTRIVFDGAYKITSKNINGEVFQCMTFNKENDLRYKPDKKYVYGTDYYFPGTAISVNIMLSDDDIRELN